MKRSRFELTLRKILTSFQPVIAQEKVYYRIPDYVGTEYSKKLFEKVSLIIDEELSLAEVQTMLKAAFIAIYRANGSTQPKYYLFAKNADGLEMLTGYDPRLYKIVNNFVNKHENWGRKSGSLEGLCSISPLPIKIKRSDVTVVITTYEKLAEYINLENKRFTLGKTTLFLYLTDDEEQKPFRVKRGTNVFAVGFTPYETTEAVTED